MIEIPLTEDGIRWAKKERERRVHMHDYFPTDKRNDTRWIGLAAEYEFNQWAKRTGVPMKWHQGPEPGPDFTIGNGADAYRRLQIGLKVNSGDAPRDDFVFMINAKSARQQADGLVMGIVNVPSSTLWIAGYIAADRFRKLSRKARKGQTGLGPKRPVAYDCYTLRADQLEPAEMFFELIRRAA